MLIKQILLLLITFLISTFSLTNIVRDDFETETQTAISISSEKVVANTTAAVVNSKFVLLTSEEETSPKTQHQESISEKATEPLQELQHAETSPLEAESQVVSEETIPVRTEFVYVEKFPEPPQYFQQDYPDVKYGNYGTVSNHGCGITSLAMVLTYLLDEEILPDILAEKYARYSVKGGSDWGLFTAAAEDFGLTVEKVHFPWESVVAALENGQVIIANPVADSIFTDGGHFIVLYGITEDGKILVRDPNRFSVESELTIFKDGFENGFDQKYLKYNSVPWWIFGVKDIDSLCAKAENETLNVD